MTRPRSTSSSRTRLARAALAPARPARGSARRRARHRRRARDRRGDGAAARRRRAGTWSRSTAPRTTRGCRTRWAPSPSCRRSRNERVVAIAADVSDAEALGGAVEIAERRWGGLDAIVAAAGRDRRRRARVGARRSSRSGGARGQPRRRADRRARRHPRAAAPPRAARGPLHRGRLRPPRPAGCRCSPPTAPPRRA